MQVDHLTPDDADFAGHAIRKLKGLDIDPPQDVEHMRRLLENEANLLVVARDGHEPVGFALAYVMDRIDRDEIMLCLYEISVAPSHQRRGVGSALVEHLKVWCAQHQVMKMWVLTDRANIAAIRLYSASGAEEGGAGAEVSFVWNRQTLATHREG